MSFARIARRALPLLALAAALAGLVALSSLPGVAGIPPFAAGLVAGGALVVALLPALVASGSPLPATLAVVVPVLAVAAYDQSHLDWLRLLKDFGVADPSRPDPLRALLAVAALALAWATHVIDLSARLRRDAERRGVVDVEARAAARVSRRVGLVVAWQGLLAATIIGGVAVLLAEFAPASGFGGGVAIVVPLAAIGLLALGAWAVSRPAGRA